MPSMTWGNNIGNTSNANSQQIMSVIFRKENLTFCSNFAPLDPVVKINDVQMMQQK